MAWFKKARKPIATPRQGQPGARRAVGQVSRTATPIIYNKDLAKNLSVCPKCAHHFRLSAAERLRTLFDDEHWVEHDAGPRARTIR